MKWRHQSIFLMTIILMMFPSGITVNSLDFTTPVTADICSMIDVTFSITQLYNCSDAIFLTHSGDYLYLQNGSFHSRTNQVMVFEKEHLKATFWPPYQLSSVNGLASWNHILFISRDLCDWFAAVEAWSFANYSAPMNFSLVSHYTTGGISDIGSYYSYVYLACFEWGFPIFDFSNVSHPIKVGNVPLETWHSEQCYVVSHFGLFVGDHRTGLFDLSFHPLPKKLWTTPDWSVGAHILSPSGRFAVSENYFVINDDGTLVVIPCIDGVSCESAQNLSVPVLKGSSHCALFDDDQVLLVAGQNNTITVLDISAWDLQTFLFLPFSPIAEIYLGPTGTIKDLLLTDTNELYIADGANGLLKLNLNVTRENLSSTTNTPGFFHLSVLLVIVVIWRIKKSHNSR